MQKALGDFYVVLKKIGLVLLLFTICRLIFFLLNRSHFVSDIWLAFIGGIRFDLSAIAYLNAPFIFFSLLPFSFRENRIYKKINDLFFILINTLGVLFNIIDSEFFKFQLKRSTFDFFSLFGAGEDMGNLLPQYIKDYWYLLLILIVLIWSFAAVNRKIDKAKNHTSWTRKTNFPAAVVFAISFILVVIAGRGGIQLRPLSIINASTYGNAQNVPLILNTPFTILRSINSEYITEQTYFTQAEKNSIFNGVRKTGNVEKTIPNTNVVIIILESFSYEFMHQTGQHGELLTPFLDSLSSVSLSFPNAYANGKRSLEGVPSICSGIPSLMRNPLIFSPYSGNEVGSIASVLNKYNYSSSFFHGGINGTMGFDAFASSIGYEQYFGKDEYPESEHYDGTWGIYDEYFYSFFCNKLNEAKKPFNTVFFSLSSHHPYKIPKHHQDKFPIADNPYESVIQYGDYALSTFFEKAKKQPWFDNTIFVITADHTAPSEDAYYNNRNGFYRVPLLFYGQKVEAQEIHDVAQHTDILPTLIDLLELKEEFVAYGRSLVQDDEHYVYQFIGDVYQIIGDGYHLEFDGEKTIAFYDLENDKLMRNNLLLGIEDNVLKSTMQQMERHLKAVIQDYNFRMINNQLVPE